MLKKIFFRSDNRCVAYDSNYVYRVRLIFAIDLFHDFFTLKLKTELKVEKVKFISVELRRVLCNELRFPGHVISHERPPSCIILSGTSIRTLHTLPPFSIDRQRSGDVRICKFEKSIAVLTCEALPVVRRPHAAAGSLSNLIICKKRDRIQTRIIAYIYRI